MSSSTWRYQPVVWGDSTILIECHFENDVLAAWDDLNTDYSGAVALGEDVEDLLGTLDRMRQAVLDWEEVAYEDICPGFEFTRRL